MPTTSDTQFQRFVTCFNSTEPAPKHMKRSRKTARDHVREVLPHVQTLRERGFSYEGIAELMTQQGMKIKAGTLQGYFRELRKELSSNELTVTDEPNASAFPNLERKTPSAPCELSNRKEVSNERQPSAPLLPPRPRVDDRF